MYLCGAVLFHLEYLCLECEEPLADGGHGGGELDLEDELADVHQLYAAHGGRVGTEDALAEDLSHQGGHVGGKALHDALVAVLQVDEDDAAEGWVAEELTFLGLLTVHPLVVVRHHLLHDVVAGVACLEQDMSACPFASGAACNLLHELEGPFVAAEVGLCQHLVGGEDADEADVVEVESLRHHLCADEDVGVPLFEVVQYLFVALSRARGVEVHACDACLGQDALQLLFDALRTVAARGEVVSLTFGARSSDTPCG